MSGRRTTTEPRKIRPITPPDEILAQLQELHGAAADEREQRQHDAGDHEERQHVDAAIASEFGEAPYDRRSHRCEQRFDVTNVRLRVGVDPVGQRDIDDEFECDRSGVFAKECRDGAEVHRR